MDYNTMSLKEKVLQTFIVTMREINKFGGPQAFFEKYPVGGLYYSKSDKTIGTVETGTATNAARLAECRKASRLPLLVCADGLPARGQRFGAGMDAVAGSNDEEAAYQLGKIVGMQMNDNDVDWVLGPHADLLLNETAPLFGWSDTAEDTSRLVNAMIRGIQDQGVCATIKHFPGLGTDHLNMHATHGRNRLSFGEWMDNFGLIYRNAAQQGVLSVMTTHATLTSYDDEMHEGYYPIATYSAKLTTQLLKEELGFEGAVVTDALIMGGMVSGDLVEDTVMAFKCGADLLLWPPMEAADRIVELLESGEIPMSRLEDALARIDKMRAFRENALAHPQPVDVDYINSTCQKISRDGMCLLRNKAGLLPLKSDVRRIMIIDATTVHSENSSSYLLKAELEKRGYAADVKRDIYDVPSNVCWQDDFDALTGEYDVVILNLSTGYVTMDNNVPFLLTWGSHMVDRQKKIVINYGSPFFAPTYFPEAPTYIEVNTGGNASSISALVDKMVGKDAFTGQTRLKKQTPAVKGLE